MLGRLLKGSVTGWRPWAIGAALSVGVGALLLHRWQRAEWRRAEEAYQDWWRQRERVRANGDRPAVAQRAEQPELFV